MSLNPQRPRAAPRSFYYRTGVNLSLFNGDIMFARIPSGMNLCQLAAACCALSVSDRFTVSCPVNRLIWVFRAVLAVTFMVQFG